MQFGGMPFKRGGKHNPHNTKRVSIASDDKGAADFIRLSTDDKFNLLWNSIEEIKEAAKADREKIQETKRDLEKLMQKVEELDYENEYLRRELISLHLRVRGIPEGKHEAHCETEKKVKDLLSKMGLGEIYIADARRIGKKTDTISRPIIINLIRKQDKFAILSAKRELETHPELKGIFIDPERTTKESRDDKLLRDTGRIWKCANPAVKIKIRNAVLSVENAGSVECYRVDRRGRVEKFT